MVGGRSETDREDVTEVEWGVEPEKLVVTAQLLVWCELDGGRSRSSHSGD